MWIVILVMAVITATPSHAALIDLSAGPDDEQSVLDILESRFGGAFAFDNSGQLVHEDVTLVLISAAFNQTLDATTIEVQPVANTDQAPILDRDGNVVYTIEPLAVFADFVQQLELLSNDPDEPAVVATIAENGVLINPNDPIQAGSLRSISRIGPQGVDTAVSLPTGLTTLQALVFRVSANGNNGGDHWLIFFEDQPLDTGDRDYNDLVIEVRAVNSNVIPEPGTGLLIGGVLLAACTRRRRRSPAQSATS